MTRARQCSSYRADGERCSRGGSWVSGQRTITDCFQHVVARARDENDELITNLRTMRTLRVADLPERRKPQRRPRTAADFLAAFKACNDSRSLHRLISALLATGIPDEPDYRLSGLGPAIADARTRCRAADEENT